MPLAPAADRCLLIAHLTAAQGETSSVVARGIALFMVRGIAVMVKPPPGRLRGKRTAKGTLPFSHLRLSDVTQEAGVGCADLREVIASLGKAQLAVHGQPDVGGVVVLLAVILPPADRAKPHGGRDLQRLVSATRAPETVCFAFHFCIDVGFVGRDYEGKRIFRPDLVAAGSDWFARRGTVVENTSNFEARGLVLSAVAVELGRLVTPRSGFPATCDH
jgi:hypothetical protein